MNKKTRSLIGAIVLLVGMTLGVIVAYTPTYELCYDENGRGYECYEGILILEEYAIWNRILTEEQTIYLFNEGNGRDGLSMCYDENGRGYTCWDYYVKEVIRDILVSDGGRT